MTLASDIGGERVCGIIVETEAYVGEHDAACHAAAGRTGRTDPLYGAPGIAYVYFIYGVHWCVNAVTRPAGLPSAVLIRALEPVDGHEAMRERRPRARRPEELTNGPGKLCAALGITGAHNRLPLQQPPIVIRRGPPVPDDDVVETTRIGISKAADWPLRWYVAEAGAMLWSDNMLVPNKATHKTNAEKLMDYYYDPEVAARLAAWVWYVSPVEGAREAMEKVDPALVDQPLIFPDEAFLANTWAFMDVDEKTRQQYDQDFAQVIGA